MARTPPNVPLEKLALYERLVATNPAVQRKGAANPYTSRNGHMFSFMTQGGTLALRLPTDEREAFLKRYKTGMPVVYNTVMKEYVEVPDTLLRSTARLKKYFDMSYEYIGTLKPKPTTRKKTAGSKKKVSKKTSTKKTATSGKTTTAARKKKTTKKTKTAKKTGKTARKK